MNNNEKESISIKKNYFYNLLLLIFNTSFPLITAPYVSRILGANNLGIVNYSYSIISMFVVLAGFGLPIYGIRGVARTRKDKEELSILVSNIFILLIIFTVVCTFFYLIFVYSISDDSLKKALLVMIIYLISIPISFEWFFIGIEQFRYITIRSVIIKALAFIAMLLFVREKEDYLIYAFILAFFQSITFLINFIQSKKYWHFNSKKIKLLNLGKESSVFFITLLISSTFTIFDKVLVGSLTDNISMALYFRNRQITMMLVGVSTSLVKVLSPRLSSLIHEKNNSNYSELLNSSYQVFLLISIPLVFGISVVGKDILFLFGGKEFMPGSVSFVILGFWTVSAGINVFIDNQISIPNGKEYYTTIASLCIAAIMIVLNIFLTPKYGINGASLSLFIAETCGVIVNILFIYRNTKIKFIMINKEIIKILISSIIMFIIIKIFDRNSNFGYIQKALIQIPIGVIVYIFSLIILKSNLIISYLIIMLEKVNIIKKGNLK